FSPYYLHPSKGIGAVISPILLKGDTYEEWSRSLRTNLRAKNKLGFIDGTIVVLDVKSSDFDQWGIVNSMLVAWIVNTLDVSICSTVPFPDHVKSLWDDLRDRYSLGNGPRILELKSQIADSANEYVKIQENQLLHHFCMELDSKKFGSNVSTLLMMDPIPSIMLPMQ
ncbi:Long chronological lifespan protein 2, partial [Bienertia sinuspersici]